MHVVWLHLDDVVTDLVSAVAVARPLMEHIEVLADEPVWRSEEFGRAVGLDRLDDLVNDQDAWVRERSGFTWSLGAGHRSYALHVNLSIGFRKGAGSSVIVRLRHDETDREAFDRMVAVYDDLIADARADKASLYHGGNDYQERVYGQVDDMDRRIPGVGWRNLLAKPAGLDVDMFVESLPNWVVVTDRGTHLEVDLGGDVHSLDPDDALQVRDVLMDAGLLEVVWPPTSQ